MKKQILVTGATGNVGSELVRQLVAAGHEVRALVHNEAQASRLPSEKVKIVLGDYAKPATLDAALSGVDAVYALTPIAEAATAWMTAIIDAAKRAGVARVVKHSGYGASAKSSSGLSRSHAATDEHLRQLGISYTILQPNSYMQNLLWVAEGIRRDGTFYLPFGDAKQSVVDVADIAAVAVKALSEPGHEKQTYVLSGPESLSYAELADAIGAARGKPVSYIAVPTAAAEQAMKEHGMPAWNAHTVAEFYGSVATGAYAAVTDHVKKVLGRAPTSFRSFIERYGDAFR
jgi:uncharacterized protein YbjT (DUF2867 family)